jgi:hypothetical protein
MGWLIKVYAAGDVLRDQAVSVDQEQETDNAPSEL